MELEFAVGGLETEKTYPFRAVSPSAIEKTTPSQPAEVPSALILDWSPAIKGILSDLARKIPVREISAKFHNGLAETIIAVVRHVGQQRVVLSGGCFQNRCLTERTVHRLQAAGFRPYWHQRVPPNDGGVALGQALAAAGSLGKEE